MARKKRTKEEKKTLRKKVAVGTGALASRRRVSNATRRTVYQRDWVRPNGDVVRMKGFSAKNLAEIKPTMDRIDSLTQSRHHTAAKEIRFQKMKARHGGSWNTSAKRVKLQSRPISLEGIDKVNDALDMTQGLPRRQKIGIARRAYKEGLARDRSDNFAHEFAHTLDDKFEKSSTGFAKRAGWRKNVINISEHDPVKTTFQKTKETAMQSKKQRMQSRNTLGERSTELYAKTSSYEDFAESYRHGINNQTGRRKGIHYDAARRKFMNQRVLQHGVKHDAQMRNVKLLERINKKHVMIGVGAAAVAGGGYYYYRKHKSGKRIRVKNSRRRNKR